jgi:cyclohexanecarboxyl-CoA dehydrogenase
MLDFSFTPAQDEYRERLRELALRELLPRYREGDAEERYPADQIRRIIRFGDEFWKGREEERDLITVGITAEEVARGDFNCVLPSLGPRYQSEFFAGLSPELAERWLPELLSGEKVVGLCVTEPAAGSDMSRLEMRAERRGDRYVLNGVKNSASYLNADVFYVFARTDARASGWRESRPSWCRATPRGSSWSPPTTSAAERSRAAYSTFETWRSPPTPWSASRTTPSSESAGSST